MKARKRWGHICFTILMIVLLVGLPIATHFDILPARDGVNAVSSASIELPDQPSGDFIVFINKTLHEDTMDVWDDFFHDRDFEVIFEDVHCLVSQGDVTGQQLAERFQLQLPENQMILRSENPTLLVSKVENGYIDIAVFSSEMAEAMSLALDDLPETVEVLMISGEGGETA